MGAAKKVIEELKSGVSPEELARKITWKDLSMDDSEDLLAVALRLGDNHQSYNLLVYLFHISFSRDLWYSTEVLSQAVQHPNMTQLDRQAILPTMRNRLDQIKDLISTKAPPEERLTKYWLMEATYYSVNGNLLSETGNRVEATHNYQIAQSIFEQLGQFQKAAEYKALNRRLLSKDAFKSPLPKTSPIRMPVAPTQPISSPPQPNQLQPKPAGPTPASAPVKPVEPSQPTAPTPRVAPEIQTPAGQPGQAAQPEKPTPPSIEGEETTRPAIPEKAVLETPLAPATQPIAADQDPADSSSRLTTRLASHASTPETVSTEPAGIETAPAETAPAEAAAVETASPKAASDGEPVRPSAGAVVDTLKVAPQPKKMAEVTPTIPEPGQVEEIVIQLPETTQAPETILVTPPPEPEPTGAPTAPLPESPSVTGIYYPLPDVWLEDGRLHILGVDHFKGDESADLTEQIRQQCDILIGIQLQIKMYQTRRRMLDQEMKVMENKARSLRARLQKLENRLVNVESAEETPSI